MVARRRRLRIASVAIMMSNDSARCLTLRVREARVLMTEPMESEDMKARRAWGSENEDGRRERGRRQKEENKTIVTGASHVVTHRTTGPA